MHNQFLSHPSWRLCNVNKAFVREPEFDGRVYCPRCGTIGVAVGLATLDHHIRPESRSHLGDSAWFCNFARCDAAYFDQLERVVAVDELLAPVYPKDPSAPICPCFGFNWDDVDADIAERSPTRIRELLAKSQSSAARCATLAADGQCCLTEVQRLYIRGV